MDLRIGVLTDQYPSKRKPNRGTFVRDLVEQLRSAGVDVTVISSERNLARMSIEYLLRSMSLDVFDAQFVAPAGVLAALTPHAAPFVVTAHRWDIMEFPHRWPMARMATVVTLNSANGIIAVSREIRSEVMKFVGAGDRVVTIPNAVNVQRFRPGVEVGSLKERLGIPENHLVILSVGHLIPRKGFQYLVRAMTSIVKECNECSLVIAGEGPLHEELLAFGRRLGLGNRIVLAGAIEESVLPSFYSMADVFAMPSLSEGHCVSILEAMSSGKSVVASAIAGNADSVTHGKDGLLVRKGDAGALSDAILTLVRDEALRRALGRNARETVIKQFRWEIRLRRLICFYQSVL